MKKMICLLFILILLTLSVKTSHAFLMKAVEETYNTIPISPVVNFGEDIAETGKMTLATRNRVKALLIQSKTDISNLSYSFSSMFSVINNIIPFRSLEETENTKICGSKPEEMDVNKMAIKMKEILLTYKKASQKVEVERNRLNFYLDNIYNIYAGVKLIKADLAENGIISTAIATTKECCSEGNGKPCGIASTAPSAESEDGGGNNATLHAYGYALATMEDLVKMWERVITLKAQYESLKAMMSVDVMPRVKDEETSDEVSTPQTNAFLDSRGFARISSAETMASAQVMYKDATLSNIEFDEIPEKVSKVYNVEKTEEAIESKQFGLKFNSLEASDDYSAIIENSTKLEAYNELGDVEDALEEAVTVHNFIKQIDGYRESAEQYKNMKKEYTKKLQILNESNKCGKNYISKYFTNADKTWSGKQLKTISDLITFVDSDEKEGISGWAIDAYDMAKAAETVVTEEDDGTISYEVSSIQTEDLETEILTDEDLEGMEDNVDLEKAEKKIDSKKELYDEGGGISATASKNTQDENRRASLIAWNIGVLAAKELSLNSDSWGTSTNRKMIWNDTKAFYGQYLRRKYDNIKSYLKRFTTHDIIDVFVSKLTNATIGNISRTLGNISGSVSVNTATSTRNNTFLEIGNTDYQNELKTLYAKYDNELNNITGQNNSSTSKTLADPNIQNERLEVIKKIDEVSKSIKEISDEISIKTETAEEKSFEENDKQVNKGVDYSGDGQTTKNKLTSPNDINEDIAAIANKEKEGLQIKNLEQSLEKLRNDRNDLHKKLKALDDQLERSKIDNQINATKNSLRTTVEINNKKNDFIGEFENLLNRHKSNVITRLDTALAMITASEPALAISVKTIIETGAEELLNKLNSDIDAIVDGAYHNIVRMGDDIYLPSSSSRIAEIHEQMIDELKALTISKSLIGGAISIDNMIVFANLATIDTTPETQGFFVGALPRDRDLKAPYPIKDFSQPPVREIFHFDAIDFANIKPFNEEKYDDYNKFFAQGDDKIKMRAISKEDFLQYGGDVPDIWKVMLQENAFIETRFELKEALNQGCETAAFLRGGIMPCRVGNTNTVLDVNVIDTEDGKYSFYKDLEKPYIKRTDLNANDLPKCFLIGMQDDEPYHSFYDVKVKANNTTANIASPQCKYSELGMILDADEYNNLSFKEVVYEVFNNMFEIEKATEEDGDDIKKKAKRKLAVAKQAELSRNQIGDFIRQVEQEKKIRQSLEEMKQSNEKQMAELKSILEGFGYSIGDNYDITKESDYDLTIDKLKLSKNKSIAKVTNMLSSIKIDSDNKQAKTRKQSIETMIKILRKDKEGDVELSMSTMDDEDELLQALNSAIANKSVIQRYREKIRKEKEKNGEYKDLEEAYCANY